MTYASHVTYVRVYRSLHFSAVHGGIGSLAQLVHQHQFLLRYQNISTLSQKQLHKIIIHTFRTSLVPLHPVSRSVYQSYDTPKYQRLYIVHGPRPILGPRPKFQSSCIENETCYAHYGCNNVPNEEICACSCYFSK